MSPYVRGGLGAGEDTGRQRTLGVCSKLKAGGSGLPTVVSIQGYCPLAEEVGDPTLLTLCPQVSSADDITQSCHESNEDPSA